MTTKPINFSGVDGLGQDDFDIFASAPNASVLSTRQLVFGSSGAGAPDVGLKRTAAGIILVTNGSSGFGSFIANTPSLTKAISYALLATDHTVYVNAASLTITLPSAITATAGREYALKNTNLGTSTTVAATAGTIDNAVSDTTTLVAALAFATYKSDGANWWRVR